MPEINSKYLTVDILKQELMDKYIFFMVFAMGMYAITFRFLINSRTMSLYLISGLLFLAYSYFLVRKKYPLSLIVHLYLIIAPLYNFYIMVTFWNYTIASFFWLLAVPLGAYIFFSKKEALLYAGYVLVIIITATIVANNLHFSFVKYSQKMIIFSDTILFISNIIVFSLLIYYKDKIEKLKIVSELENIITQKEDVKEGIIIEENIDIDSIENLFEKIENLMIEQALFKDIKLNLSKLNVLLNTNTIYISRAIRHKGYSNFNTYLNTHRIMYVKKLFSEANFQKNTLMYIYTEAGFSNQSTFNRAFKQIEGITPSEYLQKI
ncbi:helix-turn-helix domain-containing protein [Chryseobacterium sp. SIMBA_029]|uniref:helix-turn-helix domain-containing protein n=1 Tax=Chryseobacterium sp. SIMBA_029 TaxID=3085772 RepID=UPI00397BF20C